MGELAKFRKEKLEEIERYEDLADETDNTQMADFYRKCAERERKKYWKTFKRSP